MARLRLAAVPPFVVAVLLAWLPAPASARPADHVMVALITADRDAALERLSRHGDVSLGLTSAALGDSSPGQSALDVSQGSRVDARLMSGPPPRLELEAAPRSGGGRLRGWAAVRRRARAAPATLEPGLLAETVRKAGGQVGLVGPRGAAPAAVAAIASDRSGRIERVDLTDAGGVAAGALAQWRSLELVVAALPEGVAGLDAVDGLLAARRPRDVVYLLVRPRSSAQELWVTALAAPGRAGTLRSQTTRQTGLVSATDAAPTVLAALGLDAPPAMQGRVLERVPGRDARDLAALAERIESIGRRRFALLAFSAAAIVAVGLAGLASRRRGGGRAAARLLVLAALWSPSMLLLSAALRPGAASEIALVVCGSLALGALTDLRLPWPRGPALPALVGLAAHALDLALGSRLVLTSLAGINPLYGARFYGIGNQLEAMLAVLLLVGAGAALSRGGQATGRGRLEAPPRGRARSQAAGFATACLAGALVIGPARLGADVGGVITLSAGGAGAIAATLSGNGRRLALGALLLAPLAAVALLALVDLASSSSAHLTRSVLEAGSVGDLLNVLERRVRLSVAGLDARGARGLVALSLAALALAAWRRRELGDLLSSAPAYRAGVAGALAATVIGTLANDSGPTVLVIGTCGLALALLYAAAAPAAGRASTTLGACESPSYRRTHTATRGA